MYRIRRHGWYLACVDELSAIAARIQGWDQTGPAGPWTLEIYPTLRCNLDCAFCDTTDRHRPPVHELPMARWLQIVDEAAAMGVQRVCVLGGGEPFISQATPPLLKRIKAHGMAGFITTNGTLCSPPVLKMLVEIGWDEIHFSIDGASPATHDALRGRNGAFRKTVTTACRLRGLRDQAGQASPRIALHTVVTRTNYTEMADIVRLAAALGAFRVDFDALVPYRPEQHALALRPEDLPDLRARLPEAIAEAERWGIATTLENFAGARTLQRGQAPPPRGQGEGLGAAPCLKAWHYLVIQADGRTSPCCVLAGEGEAVGSDEGVADLWKGSPFLNQIRTMMRQGRPAGRCAECSENILVHERAIRARLQGSV